MTQKKKLVLGPLPEQLDDYSKYEESVTRWDRIITALVLIVLVIGVSVYALVADDEPNQTEVAQHQPQLSTKAPDLNAQESSERLSEVEPHNTAVIDQVNKETVASTSIMGSKDSPKILQPKLKEANAVKSVAPSKQKDIQAEKTITHPEQKQEHVLTRVKPAVVNIKHNSISRAVLTQELKDKEPVSELSHAVALPPEGIIKVMLYTEMEGLRGTTLYHEWYLNQDRQARVKIPVNVSQQRSHSSKYINTQMTGEWQVRVVDDKSKVYVKADFRVTKP